jgi:hypothetical protein
MATSDGAFGQGGSGSAPSPGGRETGRGSERLALIALVRWLGQSHEQVLLPIDLHAQVREALGDDFYVPVND